MMHYRQIIDLGGNDWQLGCVPARSAAEMTTWDCDAVAEWLPATVPGDVRADLLALGRIPDPYFGLNNELSQWVDEHDWWYRKDLSLRLGQNERAFLVFNGVDYLSAIFFDGQLIGTHEGMFSRQIYEITPFLTTSEQHSIAVRIVASSCLPKPELTLFEQLWDQIISRIPRGDRAFPDRFGVLKCQMGFGWDFAARIRTMGIWDTAMLHIVRSAYIRDPRVVTRTDGNQAHVVVEFTIDSDRTQRLQVRAEAQEHGATTPQASARSELNVSSGLHKVVLNLAIEKPKLWEPWDRGEANLYDLTLVVEDATGAPCDAVAVTFGIREIRLQQHFDLRTGTEPYTLLVNGRREFIRGANWVPADAMPGRVRRKEYETLIEQARRAGVNMLRVWGGGLREKADFYELCDEKGILVWQEFPFACAFFGYYPLRGRFRQLVQNECTDIVRQLRNHPSIAVWCGGNEFSPRRNWGLVSLLKGVVTAEDGTRPFRRVSPDGDESHNWRIWHSKASVSHFRRDRSRILGEFGLQAVPDRDSLSRFIRPENLWPPNGEWTYHGAELPKMIHYLRPWFSERSSSGDSWLDATGQQALDAFIWASQQAQAHGVQVAIEHVRRRKGQTGGAIIWQLNEPWPAISWSLIDYYGRPKAAFHKLAEVYNPVLVSVLYPLRRYRRGEELHGEVWLINDLLTTIVGAHVEIALDGEIIYTAEVTLPPDSRQMVGRLHHRLTRTPETLSAKLTQGGRVISSNTYDLRYDARHERSWPDHLFGWLAEFLLRCA